MLAFVGCKKDSATNPSVLPPPTPTADITRAVDELNQAWSGVTTFTGKIESRLAEAIGRKGRTLGAGTYDLRRDGDKLQIRFELGNTLHIDMDWENGVDLATAEFLLWITDGTIMYQSTRQAKKYYRVTKSHYDDDAILQLASPVVLRDLMTDHVLTLLPDDVLDARSVTVIEAAPVSGTWKETHYFDKETGIRVKHVEVDADGKQYYRMALTDLKVGTEFAPEHFDYEVPEAAELVDETK
jgi:hypothetical protein